MEEMHVGVIGASGFIGRNLCDALEAKGHTVIRISRREHTAPGQVWRVLGEDCILGLDAIVNLAGDPIDKRWTDANKKKFRESRVGLTKEIRGWLERAPEEKRPKIWLNASAVGYYGDRGEDILDEHSPAGNDYLSELCADWESAAHGGRLEGVRVVNPRIGVILGEGGMAWIKMKKVFSTGLGGKLGNGKQWFPWMHVHDLVYGMVHCLEHDEIHGPVNMVAPGVVRNEVFSRNLAKALGKPALIPVPRFGLRIILGEFADALLASQRVFPGKLEESGFKFAHPELEDAISDLLK
ncbi:epimerase family protein Rv2216 [Rubritalea halochordaticola]|uniref:Epimerase family protein Rv2216 n=1 Tax=Rubritalea halochordaticola TaxID=714537 RepID=A0ABP9V041_9BACT